jgi:hypothetical protein
MSLLRHKFPLPIPYTGSVESDLLTLSPSKFADFRRWISASFCLLVAACSIALSLILIHENKQMEREGLIPPKSEGPQDGLQDREKHLGRPAYPRYRYIW